MISGDALAAAGYAVLLWWAATGVIWFLDQRKPSTFRVSFASMSLVACLALLGTRSSAQVSSVGGAYLAFSCAVLLWGWLEMSFLMGYITGPRRSACASPCRGPAHFRHAVEAIFYNEVATACIAAAIAWLAAGAPNRTALLTFLVLWCMRISAKLNLFLGVRNTGEAFLPLHLVYLKSFFRQRTMNPLFPLSVGIAGAAAAYFAACAAAAESAADSACYTLIAALMGLALIEHIFMMISWPSETLWKWAFKPKQSAA